MKVNTMMPAAPGWMSRVLRLAAAYNLVWGAWVVLFPLAIFRWTGLDLPQYPQIWQCVGMIVGVFGVGYWIAASSPYQHWPIVLVGLLGKILGPLGFLSAAMRHELPWSWSIMILSNDVIWWVPFAVILYEAARTQMDSAARGSSLEWGQAVREVRSHRGATLAELSTDRPTLVVFLRHAGCTFCREALGDLSRCRRAIEAEGVRLAIVHMSEPLRATMRFEDHNLSDIHRYSDQECLLYRAFGLNRGTFAQLFGLRVLRRGFVAAVYRGCGIGLLEGDGFQLPGVVLLYRGHVLAEFRASSAADRPDYVGIAQRARAAIAGRRDPAAGLTAGLTVGA